VCDRWQEHFLCDSERDTAVMRESIDTQHSDCLFAMAPISIAL